ncbi:hypothetical protein CXF95_01420 [Paraglaciecola sp. MB-3u-78]|nr:hypothetical protein CXF95_01420 [Paraglaciecola sp. MB-3u-78]
MVCILIHLTQHGCQDTFTTSQRYKPLAIRIIFPLVRVTPLSFKRTGLPASLGRHEKSHLR